MGGLNKDGSFVPSERARAIPPWPIMGYDMPRTVKGITTDKVFEIKLWGIVVSIKRLHWVERKIGGA